MNLKASTGFKFPKFFPPQYKNAAMSPAVLNAKSPVPAAMRFAGFIKNLNFLTVGLSGIRPIRMP